LSEFLEWQVVCTKVREGDKRIVRLKEGHVSGHHVVIVDDLVQSGGTLIECQVSYEFLNYMHISLCVFSMQHNNSLFFLLVFLRKF
jgi:phosphoribosylpyrophosphate synthetase